jgi:hypoxia up-regulated 1
MAESKAKMEALALKDKERQMLESSRNKVESFIYRIKNKLIDDEENINKVTTEEQRAEVSKLSSDAEEWMYDDGYNADLPTMEDKYAELATPADKIFFRVAEMTARPAAVKALTEKLGKIEKLVKKWETTHPQITEDERASVSTKVEEVKTWLAEKVAEQEATVATEDPVLTSAELPGKTKLIEPIVTRLSKKPKPKPKKNETKEEETIDINLDNETKAEDAESTKEEVKEDAGEAAEEEEATDTEDGEDASTGDEL